jgi:HSP20 family molecular chaperone IbpA
MIAKGGTTMAETNVTTRPGTNVTAQEVQRVPTAVPRVDIIEDQTGITLWADLPGVSRDSLEIKVEGDTLTIEGNVSLPVSEGMEPIYAEIRAPRYARSFTLSRDLDTAAIQAKLNQGVLELRIPKHQQAQPKRITVQAG